MSEYIEREALTAEMQHPKIEINDGQDFADWYSHCVRTVPAADVAPVVHGEWVEAKLNGMSLYPVCQKMCSVCGQIMPSRWETMPPFCYGCGCKMDAKSEAGK